MRNWDIPLASAHRADDDAEATANLSCQHCQSIALPEDTLNLTTQKIIFD